MCTRTHFEKEAEIIRKWAIKLQQTNIYAWDWTPYPPLLDSASSYTCPYPPHEVRWTELKPQEWVHRSPYFSEPPCYVTANSIFTPINFLCIKRGSLRKYIATEQKKKVCAILQDENVRLCCGPMARTQSKKLANFIFSALYSDQAQLKTWSTSSTSQLKYTNLSCTISKHPFI